MNSRIIRARNQYYEKRNYPIKTTDFVEPSSYPLELMSDSPFGPAKSIKRRERKFFEKLYVKTLEKADEFYVDSIPSDDVKAMPPRYMYPIGGFILTILMCVFVAVFLPSYLEAIHQKYLSPGSTSSSLCSEVTITNSGNYLATQTGYWIGGLEFQYSLSSYMLSVQNMNVNTDEFIEIMDVIYEYLTLYGNLLKTQDLGVTLLYWMSFTLVSSYSTAQRFYLTGNPVVVFNREITVGSISNEFADCNLQAYSTFDQANGVMTFSYDYEAFMSNPTCNTTLSPLLFGYTTMGNAEDLSLSLDVRALITAFAMNYGILEVEALQEIISGRNTFYYEGAYYNASQYVNPNFPGMAPVYCIKFANITHCVVSIGATFGLPYFNHMGSNTSFPSPCNCSTLTATELDDKFNNCNLFSFISGLLVYDQVSSFPLFKMAVKFNGSEGILIANDYMYYASFIGSVWGKNSPYSSEFNNPEFRAELYDFCYLPDYGGCSLIIFSSFDVYNYNWAVSDYYYSLPNGACRDTVTTTPEKWQMLVDTPYAPLTQSYSECRNSPTTVFFNQVGVAVGNVSVLSPFGVLFVLVLIGIYQNLTGRAIPKTFSRAEKDSALDALAVALLKARDEQRKKKINPEHQLADEPVTHLVENLARIAENSNGTYYKREEVDKFEVDWGAMVRAPFSRSASRSQSSSFSEESKAVELSNLEAQPSAAGGKVTFQRKYVNPTAAVQNRFPDLLILNIASSGYKGSTSLVSLRLSDMNGHAGSSIKLSSADVRSQLSDLKKDTNSDALYGQTIAALDALIDYFKETYRQLPGKKSIATGAAPFKLSIAPEHVILSDKTSVLNSIEALTRFQEIVTLNEADKDEDDEEVDDSSTSSVYLNRHITSIYKKIYALMLIHVGILAQSDGVGTVFNAYGEHTAYYVNNEVCTMSELKAKASAE